MRREVEPVAAPWLRGGRAPVCGAWRCAQGTKSHLCRACARFPKPRAAHRSDAAPHDSASGVGNALAASHQYQLPPHGGAPAGATATRRCARRFTATCPVTHPHLPRAPPPLPTPTPGLHPGEAAGRPRWRRARHLQQDHELPLQQVSRVPQVGQIPLFCDSTH